MKDSNIEQITDNFCIQCLHYKEPERNGTVITFTSNNREVQYSAGQHLSSTCSIRAEYLLVKEIQADAVVPLANNIVAEDGRVPAVASLFVVGLLAERLLA